MTVRLAGLSLALMLFVSMMAAPRPQAQTSAPDPVFFQSQVFPVFEAAKCSGCHTASGVASATRLHFPDKDATPAQIQAFGLSLSSLVDRADVAKSLLLAKPTNVIRHTGGLRIKPGSSEEQILTKWVASLASASLPFRRRRCFLPPSASASAPPSSPMSATSFRWRGCRARALR